MDKLLEIFNEHPVLVYAGAGLAVFLYVAALANERLWYQFEGLLGVSCVLGLPFTTYLLQTWLDGKDGDFTAKGLFALILLGMICLAYQIHETKYVADALVKTSLLITCILSRLGLLFAAVNAMFFSSGFSKEALSADCIFLSLLLFGNLFHLKKVSTKDGQLSLEGDIRKCALTDAVISFIVALFMVGFSDTIASYWGEEQYTPVHIMLIKSFGFQLLAFSVQAFASLCIKRDEDIVKLYLPKLWLLVPIMAWAIYNIKILDDVTLYGYFFLCTLLTLTAANLRICSKVM